jgi:putative phage-type endonuclease
MNIMAPRFEQESLLHLGLEMKMKRVEFSTISGSPNSQEWLQWRSKHITATGAVVIAKDSGIIESAPSWLPTARDLWLEKRGLSKPTQMNAAMMRGTMGEEPARLAFEEKTGITMMPAFGEMDDHPILAASFDGISFDEDGLLEIKCPSSRVHALAQSGQIVEYYKPQLAHQAMVLWGHPDTWKPEQRVFFASFVPETGDLAIVEKSAMDFATMAAQLLPREYEFWDLVERGEEPCGEEFIDLANRFLLASADLEAAKEAQESIREQLVEYLKRSGKQKIEGGGISVSRSMVKGTVNYAEALAALGISPESMEAYRGPSQERIYVRKMRSGGAA